MPIYSPIVYGHLVDVLILTNAFTIISPQSTISGLTRWSTLRVLILIPFLFTARNLLPTSTYKGFDLMLPNKLWECLSAPMGMESIKYINIYKK